MDNQKGQINPGFICIIIVPSAWKREQQLQLTKTLFKLQSHLDNLQVRQRTHVEVGDILRRRGGVQLRVAATDRLRLWAVGVVKRCWAV